MSIPFHKQTDPNKQAGQIVNPIPEQFLHQYIAKKDDSPPRITFDEWFVGVCGNDTYTQQEDIKSRMEWAWEAALTCGKIS